MKRIPVIEKMHRSDSYFIERSLPKEGSLNLKIGDSVEPFTKVGQCKVSYGSYDIDHELVVGKNPDTFIEKNVEIAKKRKGIRQKTLKALHNGFIRKVDGKYKFELEEDSFSLLAGSWGQVKDVVDKKSVLIETSATLIYAAISTPVSVEGELVVLPNPSELLEDPYFNRFTKEIAGKIIYSGYFISTSNLKKAISLGVQGIIAGGCDKASFDYARDHNFLLASFTGYGRIPTPNPIFEFLSSISSRYLFIRGETCEIIIPSKEKFNLGVTQAKEDFWIELKNDMIVQVLERPYFGWIGKVLNVAENEVKIELSSGKKLVSVNPRNLLALRF